MLYSFSKPNLRSCYYLYLKIKGKQGFSGSFLRMHSDWKKGKKREGGTEGRREGGEEEEKERKERRFEKKTSPKFIL